MVQYYADQRVVVTDEGITAGELAISWEQFGRLEFRARPLLPLRAAGYVLAVLIAGSVLFIAHTSPPGAVTPFLFLFVPVVGAVIVAGNFQILTLSVATEEDTIVLAREICLSTQVPAATRCARIHAAIARARGGNASIES
jgi:hypothetical protein